MVYLPMKAMWTMEKRGKMAGLLKIKNILVLVLGFLMEIKNGHETDFYKAKKRIDDMDLHNKKNAHPARTVA